MRIALASLLLTMIGCAAQTTSGSPPITPPPLSSTPEPAAPPSDPKADTKPTVAVLVDADSPHALIERRIGTDEQWQTTLGIPSFTSTEHWEQACVTPCRIHTDPHATYRAGGDGVAPSPRFQLPQGRDPLRLHVHARSKLAHDVGVVMSITGIVAIGLGGVGLAAASTISNYVTEVDIRTAAYASMIVGAVFLAIGVPLWILEHSTVTTDNGEELGALPRRAPSRPRFAGGALLF